MNRHCRLGGFWILTLLLLVGGTPLWAQHSPRAVVSAGGVAYAADGSFLSYSFGQTAFGWTDGSAMSVSEGVQQVFCLPIYDSVQQAQAYVSYEWNGQTLGASGDYEYRTISYDGCDSVVTLHLSLLPEGKPLPRIYSFQGRVVMFNHNAGDYRDVDHVVYRWYKDGQLVAEGVGRDYYQEDGSLLSGCFYLEVPADTSGDFWVRSDTLCLNALGINEVADGWGVLLSPNPVVSGGVAAVSILSPMGSAVAGQLYLYDAQGHLCSHLVVHGDGYISTAGLAKGIYTVVLSLAEGQRVARKLVVR